MADDGERNDATLGQMRASLRPVIAIVLGLGLIGLVRCTPTALPPKATPTPETTPTAEAPPPELPPPEAVAPVSRWPRTRAPLSDTPTPAALATDDSHACVRLANGSVRCWGSAALRSLPRSSKTGVLISTPTLLPELADVVQVTTSSSATCFLRLSGVVECVGRNYAPVPEPVPGFEDMVEISIDSSFGLCGVTPQGKVICEQHQRNRMPAQPLPAVVIDGLDDVVALSVGSPHTCVVHESGHVSCWKRSVDYVDARLSESAPQRVEPLEDAVGVTVGLSFACAWRADGGAHCWGANKKGELGNPDVDRATVPVDVVGVPHIAEIAAGNNIACARTADGEVWCWGSGDDLRLKGIGPGPTPPTRVEGLEHVVDLAVGNHGACALSKEGTVYCWGSQWPWAKANVRMKYGVTQIADEVDDDGAPYFDPRAFMRERGVEPASAPGGWIYPMCELFQLEDVLPQWLWCERRQTLDKGGYVLHEGLLQVEAGRVEVVLDVATAIQPPLEYGDWMGLSLDLMPSEHPFSLDLGSDDIQGCGVARKELREARQGWQEELDEAREEARDAPDDPKLEAYIERREKALEYEPDPIIDRMCRRVGRLVYRNGKFVRR